QANSSEVFPSLQTQPSPVNFHRTALPFSQRHRNFILSNLSQDTGESAEFKNAWLRHCPVLKSSHVLVWALFGPAFDIGFEAGKRNSLVRTASASVRHRPFHFNSCRLVTYRGVSAQHRWISAEAAPP